MTSRCIAYCRLMRLHHPIGSLLLLWPTLSALWLAAGGVPALSLLFIFIGGVFIMRSAGCVINDIIDRHFDGHVQRTANRPLVKGEVKVIEGVGLFVVLITLAFLLVLMLNLLTLSLSIIALSLAWIYPFMKRITHLPQLTLGFAYSWAIPMAYAASIEALPVSCWLLLAANTCWIVAYDTQYAMVDRDDDRNIGIKSTAILFGQWECHFIAVLQIATLALLGTIAYLNHLSFIMYVMLMVIILLFIYQQWLIHTRDKQQCFQAFLSNNYVGMSLFMGIVLAS